MKKNKFTEFVNLEMEKKWDYLSKYYELASRFHQIKDRVISDDEVNFYIKSFKERPSPIIRNEIKLKNWHFKLDEKKEGLNKQYYSMIYDENSWEKVSIPHSIKHIPDNPERFGKTLYPILAPEQNQYWDIYKTEYCTWYKTRLPFNELRNDQIAYLSFESVNLVSDLWVNENPVMLNHLGLFPFKMEITDELIAIKNNETVIALMVTSQVSNLPYFFYNGTQASYCNPPYTQGTTKQDWIDCDSSGVAGDVTLSIMNKRHIEDVFITTENITKSKATIDFRVELRNENWDRFAGNVKLEVSKWHPNPSKEVQILRKYVEVLPMNNTILNIKLKFRFPDLWSIDTPNLYLARIVLEDNEGNQIDDIYETFGMRTIKMRGSHFFLNGKKIVPRGTHDLANYFNDSLICPSDNSIVTDILLHKKMGAICSRLPSDIRMHYKKLAQYADQIGFMISWAGYFEMWTTHPEMELYAKRDVKAMIRSLRNCPSIIIWEMGDEPLMGIHHYRRFKWYEQVYNLVLEEDTSRPVIPAGYYCNELVDLINNYPEKKISTIKKRQKILQEFPIFNSELAPWDYHYCPYLPYEKLKMASEVVDNVKNALQGEKTTIFTEFGIDGMPELEKIIDIYGKFRWSGSGILPISRELRDINYYGRLVSHKDWKQTQAAQALVLSNIICYLREKQEYFAGFYFTTLIDVWTHYWGVIDANFNAKLSYFVVQGCYNPLFIAGLHGNTIIGLDSDLNIKISNLGEDLSGAILKVLIKDETGSIVSKKVFKDMEIPGKVGKYITKKFSLKNIKPGLYSIEYYICDDSENELNRRIELFFIE